MSLDLALFLFGVVVPSAFAIGKCQAYMLAGIANFSTFGLSKGRNDLGRWAIFRRYNYLWFAPLLLNALFIENGRAYPAMSPQAFLMMLTFLCGAIGLCCTFRDALERRYGPSVRRERGARFFATLMAGGLFLFLIFMETS